MDFKLIKPPPPPQQKEQFSKKGDKNFQLGRKAMQLKNWNEAINLFEKAVEIDPHIAMGWNMLGMVYANAGDTSNAVKSFERALKEFPELIDGYFNLGMMNKNLGNYQEAAKALIKLVEVYPHDRRNWEDVAIQLLDMGTKDKVFMEMGAEIIKKSLNLFPGQSNFWINLGVALRYLGKFEESVYACDYASHVLGASEKASHNKALSLWEAGKYDEASKFLQWHLLALKTEKGLSSVLEDFKKEAAEKGIPFTVYDKAPKRDMDKLRRDWVKAMEYGQTVNPNHPFGTYKLGCGYSDINEYDKAIKKLLHARSLLDKQSPYEILLKDEAVANGLASAYKGKGDFDNALKEAKFAIKSNPKGEFEWKQLAEIYHLEGDNANAIKAVKQGLDYVPDAGSIIGIEGDIYRSQNKYDKATKTYELAAEKSWNKWVYWNKIGEIYKEEGDLKKAKVFFEKAHDKMNGYAPALKNLVRVSAILDK